MPRQEFKHGDWIRIWSGRNEGLSSSIKDVRETQDGDFEYLTNYGWQPAKNLVASNDRRGSHYDRDGYCDNPSRGY